MRKTFKLLTLILVTVIVCLSLCGCWDLQEMNTLAIVNGIGLDTAQSDDELKVILQVGQLSSSGDSGGSQQLEPGGKSQSKNSAAILYEQEDKSLSAALNMIKSKMTKAPFLQHSQVLIIGREFAEKGFSQYIDALVRMPDLRMELAFVMSDTTAREILESQTEPEKISGISVATLVKNTDNYSKYLSVSLFNFLDAYLSPYTCPVLPLIKLKENKTVVEYYGTAIIKNGKLAGELTPQHMKGYAWLRGDVKKRTLRVKDGYNENSYADLNLYNIKIKHSPQIIDGKYKINIKIEGDMMLSEVQGYEHSNISEMSGLFEELAIKKIDSELNECLSFAQNLNTDVFAFGEMFHKHNLKEWDKISDRWNEIFPTIEIEKEIKMTLKNTGEIAGGFFKGNKEND